MNVSNLWLSQGRLDEIHFILREQTHVQASNEIASHSGLQAGLEHYIKPFNAIQIDRC